MSETLDNAVGKPLEVFLAEEETSLKAAEFLAEHPASLGFSKDNKSIVFAGETFGLSEADKRKLDILYKVVISGFSISPTVLRKGQNTNVAMTWSVSVNGTSVDPTTQSVQKVGEAPINLDVTKRRYVFAGIKDTTTFRLMVDGETKTGAITFYRPTYFKVEKSTFPTIPMAEDIQLSTFTDVGVGTKSYTNKSITTTDKDITPVQRVVFLYPSVLGKLTTIMNGSLDVTEDFVMNKVTLEGDEFNVYVQVNPSDVIGASISFS